MGIAWTATASSLGTASCSTSSRAAFATSCLMAGTASFEGGTPVVVTFFKPIAVPVILRPVVRSIPQAALPKHSTIVPTKASAPQGTTVKVQVKR